MTQENIRLVELEELKEFTVMNIRNIANWRLRTAERFPKDAKRNKYAANALMKLLDYVQDLPIEHDLFEGERRMISRSSYYEGIEHLNYELRYYWSHPRSTPEEFVKHVVRILFGY